jgi:hypothetical protein
MAESLIRAIRNTNGAFRLFRERSSLSIGISNRVNYASWKSYRVPPPGLGAERQVPIVVALSGRPIREICGKREPPLPPVAALPVAAPPNHRIRGFKSSWNFHNAQFA